MPYQDTLHQKTPHQKTPHRGVSTGDVVQMFRRNVSARGTRDGMAC